MNIRNLLGGLGGEAPMLSPQAMPAANAAPGVQNTAAEERGAALGTLPQLAAIAMTYTPMQSDQSSTFDPMSALERGTLFPGLELPLCNNYNVTGLPRSPMSQTQALNFAAHELALYLDTHPEDGEALQTYNALQQAANEQVQEFSRQNYPLTRAKNTRNTGRYAWVAAPWPWLRGASGR